MKRTKVIIADADIDYSKALVKALAVKEPRFSVMVDFDLPSVGNDPLSKYVLEEDTILLVDSEIKETLHGACVDSSQIIGMLPFGKEVKKRTGFINKFEGLTGIMEDLWLLSGRGYEQEQGIPWARSSRLIGVTGGAGGTGKTSIAIGLGRELCLLNDTSALYVSFENAAETEQYFPPFGGETSLNDLLYYLHTENLSQIADRRKVYLIKDTFGLETFRFSDGINELANAQVELVRKLLEQVFLWKKFEYVILDFQLEASRRCHWLLSSCDHVIVVDDVPCAAAMKTNLLLDHWRQRSGTDPDASLLYVQNKWDGDGLETMTNKRKRLYVEFDPDSFHRCEDRVEIEMDRRFGMGVKKIAATIRNGT